MPNTKRDAFARGEYVRRPIKDRICRCQECGIKAVKRMPMYEHRFEPDGQPGRDQFSGSFCSWACYSWFHDVPLS